METRTFMGKHSWRAVHAGRDALLGCGLMDQQDACALVVQEVFDSGGKHAKERRQGRFRATSTLYALADNAGVLVNADDGGVTSRTAHALRPHREVGDAARRQNDHPRSA
jgi:hypothetical protein